MMAHKHLALALGLVLGTLAGAPGAMAGSNNVLYLKQDGGNNNFVADQSGASNSSIGSLGSPATQDGPWNAATLTITGDGGHIDLSQTSGGNPLASEPFFDGASTSGYTGGNMAIATVRGDGMAAITQDGFDNLASLETTGDGSQGTISQIGYGNEAKLSVSGGANGRIDQTGIANDAGLDVQGAPGVVVSLTQQGVMANNAAQAGSYGAPITVKTNGSVSITQY